MDVACPLRHHGRHLLLLQTPDHQAHQEKDLSQQWLRYGPLPGIHDLESNPRTRSVRSPIATRPNNKQASHRFLSSPIHPTTTYAASASHAASRSSTSPTKPPARPARRRKLHSPPDGSASSGERASSAQWPTQGLPAERPTARRSMPKQPGRRRRLLPSQAPEAGETCNILEECVKSEE